MFSSDDQPIETPEEEQTENGAQSLDASPETAENEAENQAQQETPTEESPAAVEDPQAKAAPEPAFPVTPEEQVPTLPKPEEEVIPSFNIPEPEKLEVFGAGLADEEAEEDVEDTATPIEEEEEEDEDGRAWYVIHCYSGYENKVRHNLEQRIESMDMKDFIFDVVVPTEEEIEVKEGKRRSVERRVFPGYILVNMIMTEESWYVVRNTPGVTSFVGMGNDPIPLRKDEVSSIVKRMEADAPRIKVTFRQGERVRIIDGPFNDFRGTVDEIDMERAKVRVMVNFFGRETPVELDFLQVEKA